MLAYSAKPVTTIFSTIVSEKYIFTYVVMVIQGREILQSTVDLVQNNLNLEVILLPAF